MPRSKRTTSLVAVVAVVLAVATAVVVACGEEDEPVGPRTVVVQFTAPSGRTGRLTARADARSPGGWCATLKMRGTRPVSRSSCGDSADDVAGFHGALMADCQAHEALVFGTVKTGVRVIQPRRGRTPRVAASGGRPAGVGGDVRFYVLGADLRDRRPRLFAVDRTGTSVGRADLSHEARGCRTGGLSVIGGF